MSNNFFTVGIISLTKYHYRDLKAKFRTCPGTKSDINLKFSISLERYHITYYEIYQYTTSPKEKRQNGNNIRKSIPGCSTVPDSAVVVEDIVRLRNSFNHCGLLWTNREANGAAHWVAQSALSDRLTFDWCHKFPFDLNVILILSYRY